ncbi:MAG: hypothetical protein LC777_00865 [Actinobacteria bacterium]|nr:hypothetical protein [Actinomycetota bacterium]
MPLALANTDPPPSAPVTPRALIDAYLAHVAQTGRVVDAQYRQHAERFFARWPDAMAWAAEPLAVRRRARGRTRTLLTFLMLHRHLRPGYDYLLDITLQPLWRELPATALHDDLQRFRAASCELGFTSQVSKGAAGLVAARLLIQTGRPLMQLTDEDIAAFDAALRERRARTGRSTSHYGRALFSTRSVLYHLGILSRPPSPAPEPRRKAMSSAWHASVSATSSARRSWPTSSACAQRCRRRRSVAARRTWRSSLSTSRASTPRLAASPSSIAAATSRPT